MFILSHLQQIFPGQDSHQGILHCRWILYQLSYQGSPSVPFSSVPQSCPTLCDPMDYSTTGFLVQHPHPELAQTHVHQVSDAIQLSHPLSSPSPPAFNLSQHQGLFQWVSSLHQVAQVLELQLQSVLPMNIQDWFLQDWLVWSPCSPRNSQESSLTPQNVLQHHRESPT